MRKIQIKTIHQTFSIPLDVSSDLHALVKRREMSRFVSDAIRKELDSKKNELREAYLSANKDEGQRDVKNHWKETIGDGVDDW